MSVLSFEMVDCIYHMLVIDKMFNIIALVPYISINLESEFSSFKMCRDYYSFIKGFV